MSNDRISTTRSAHGQGLPRINWRTPSLRWRRLFLGLLLAMPGTLGGLLPALVLPLPLAPLLASIGAIAGLYLGFKLEQE